MIHTRTKAVTNLGKLHIELDSGLTNYSHVNYDNTNSELKVVFSIAIDQAEIDQMDNILNTFVDQDIKPKIYLYAKEEAQDKHFHNIIYTSRKELTQSLIPVRTVVQGEVQKVEWFTSLDQNNVPTDKVLIVDIVYTRDPSGFAISRTTTRTYINTDDSLNPDIKVSTKYYFINDADQIDEGVKRRSLLVKSIQKPILVAMSEILMPPPHLKSQAEVILAGRQFLTDYEADFTAFVDASASVTDPLDPNFPKKLVVIKIENENDPDRNVWLDSTPPSLGGKTIRQYLIDEFSI